MTWLITVVGVVAAAVGYAFRLALAGTWSMWLAVGVPYLVLAGIALLRLRRRELLASLLRFHRGDPTLGIAVGFGLLCGAWLVSKVLIPAGAPERAWLLRVFLVPGDVAGWDKGLILIAIVCAEELVWRGWVQSELRQRLGPRRAWVAAALLYAAAHLPTLVTLGDPEGGSNPLLVIAALGCGLCFGFLAERTGRLLPGVFAHGVFSYFAATSLRLFI